MVFGPAGLMLVGFLGVMGALTATFGATLALRRLSIRQQITGQ